MHRILELRSLIVAIALGLLATSVKADIVYSDNFNRTTLNSGGYSYVTTYGEIVNNELTFSNAKYGGDTITSNAFNVTVGKTYELALTYHGNAGIGNGFVGFSQGFPDAHYWLGGTQPAFFGGYPILTPVSTVAQRTLVDGVGSQSYVMQFVPLVPSLRLMFEDFSLNVGSETATAPNAFFDNVRVTAVPFPPAVWGGLALFSVLGVVALRRMRLSTDLV